MIEVRNVLTISVVDYQKARQGFITSTRQYFTIKEENKVKSRRSMEPLQWRQQF
jgi:hypothetical protein